MGGAAIFVPGVKRKNEDTVRQRRPIGFSSETGEYDVKHELEHFHIGDSYGGNQDWFPTFMMRIGGCGAETACDSSVYFALHFGLKKIAPENAPTLTREDYVRFAYEMKPYLSPRSSGIDRLDIYMDGYAQYLRSRGEARLSMTPLPGTAPYDTARNAVIQQIDRGYPIPTLVLNHRSKKLRDYVWHWFLINGYDDSENAFRVKAVTYSRFAWLDLAELWDTGHERRGGFVLYRFDPGEPAERSISDLQQGGSIMFEMEQNRIFQTDQNGKTVAEITFPETAPGVYTIDHTFVDESLRGRGIAGQLVRAAVEEIEKRGGQAAATCSYAVRWLKEHGMA